jgi:hypothetical protein
MRVQVMFAIEPFARALGIQRWRAMGGSPDVILPGSDTGQLTFVVPDRDSRDGQLLEQLTIEMAAAGSSARLSFTAFYEDEDIAAAELLLLEMGGLDGVLDPATVVSGQICPACHNLLRPHLVGKPRLTGKILRKADFFSAEGIVFATQPLADELRKFRGAVFTEASAPETVGEFFAIEPVSSLGYSVGPSWSAPCPKCGQLTGETQGRFVSGLYTFPRKAWDGSDFVGTSFGSNFMIVTQGPWKVLSDRRWRVAEGPIEARPVHLVDDVEPIR